MATGDYPQNEPSTHYTKNAWGSTRVKSVEPPNESGNGAHVILSVMQYDPRTAERIGDTTEVWYVDNLLSEKEMLEKELARVNERLAYIDTAVADELEKREAAAEIMAAAEKEAAIKQAEIDALRKAAQEQTELIAREAVVVDEVVTPVRG